MDKNFQLVLIGVCHKSVCSKSYIKIIWQKSVSEWIAISNIYIGFTGILSKFTCESKYAVINQQP